MIHSSISIQVGKASWEYKSQKLTMPLGSQSWLTNDAGPKYSMLQFTLVDDTILKSLVLVIIWSSSSLEILAVLPSRPVIMSPLSLSKYSTQIIKIDLMIVPKYA